MTTKSPKAEAEHMSSTNDMSSTNSKKSPGSPVDSAGGSALDSAMQSELSQANRLSTSQRVLVQHPMKNSTPPDLVQPSFDVVIQGRAPNKGPIPLDWAISFRALRAELRVDFERNEDSYLRYGTGVKYPHPGSDFVTPEHQNNNGMWQIEDTPSNSPLVPREHEDCKLSLETPAKEFKVLHKLAAELRIKIWKHSYPPRLVSLFLTPQTAEFWNGIDSGRTVTFMTTTPEVPALHICAESRAEAKKTYKMLFSTEDGPSNLYVDPAKDVLLIGNEFINWHAIPRLYMPLYDLSVLRQTLYTDRLQVHKMMVPIVGNHSLRMNYDTYPPWYFDSANMSHQQRLISMLASFDGLEELFMVWTSPTQDWNVSMSVMEKAMVADRKGETVPFEELGPNRLPFIQYRPSLNRDRLMSLMKGVLRRSSENFKVPTVHIFTDLADQPGEAGFVATFTSEEIRDGAAVALFDV